MEIGREIQILVGAQVQKPPLSTNGRFYKIYSPQNIELEPFESKRCSRHYQSIANI